MLGHTRRYFERALDIDPQAQRALALIGEIYRVEADIWQRQLDGPAKRAARAEHGEPAVRAFWQWCDAQCQRLDLEPKHPLAKALAYALARKAALEVFLADPAVPIGTNHLERGLRPIPMGRNYADFRIMQSCDVASASLACTEALLLPQKYSA